MALCHSGSLKEVDSEHLWDNFWKTRKVNKSWSKKRVIKILSKYTKPGPGPDIAVLDAGCGSGFFSRYFLSCGCDVYSMDYSWEALSTTKRVTDNKCKMYVKGDILDREKLSDINKRFDIIFTDGLLEHYSRKEQDVIMQNLKFLKKENGCIINFAPNRFSLWSLVRPFLMRIQESPFAMSEFLNLHTSNNLKLIAHGGISVLPFRISPEKLLGKHFGMLLYCVSV